MEGPLSKSLGSSRGIQSQSIYVMLLQQVTQSDVEDLDEVVVSWDEEASDLPEDWKAVVGSCLDPGPNRRIRLSELVGFWENAKCKK